MTSGPTSFGDVRERGPRLFCRLYPSIGSTNTTSKAVLSLIKLLFTERTQETESNINITIFVVVSCSQYLQNVIPVQTVRLENLNSRGFKISLYANNRIHTMVFRVSS